MILEYKHGPGIDTAMRGIFQRLANRMTGKVPIKIKMLSSQISYFLNEYHNPNFAITELALRVARGGQGIFLP